ncbi:hypothetical protein LMG28614_07129 [Paraburkholderia ultramafica]|uniref:Uncharacterized protein n=1 Tax=Paraburkholderia ultramafica TaxID=1544867 RepID=A0A6S7BRC9_9BURK|nr:hypothetical protein LMG28614_07129 [Paraburkholderia ultramafica]
MIERQESFQSLKPISAIEHGDVIVGKIAAAVLLVAMIIFWPTHVKAHECPEGKHRDSVGYCVSPGADTPPSNEILGPGEQWEYRGNGVWVGMCVQPVGECRGKTYDVQIPGGSIPVGSTDIPPNSGGTEASGGSSGVNAPIPLTEPPPEPPGAPLPDHSCAGSSYVEALETIRRSSLDQCQYFVYMRRFAAPQFFGGGFRGDAREPGTSLDATSRTSGDFILTNDGRGILLNVCSDESSFADHTATGIPSATLINGNSLIDGSPLIIFTTQGANPLVPGSPDIDTRLDLQVSENSESLTLSGTLRGDPFPSGEVFVVDTKGKTNLVTSYTTPLDSVSGPFIWLPGNRDMQLRAFNVTIPKGLGGLCGRTTFPNDARSRAATRRIDPRKAAISPFK